MKYIVHKRIKKNAICGMVNIPAKTELECEDGLIIYKNGLLCYEDSNTSHKCLARNDDGLGMERGKLTQAIMKELSKRDDRYQERWNKVWDDPECQPYRRADDDEHWLWNHEFFNADIDVLRHIATLVGAKEGK